MFPEFGNILDASFVYEDGDSRTLSKTILASQCNTDATFILHHFVSAYLRSGKSVCFLGLAQSFSHYSNVANKTGLNLRSFQDKGHFHFVEGLKMIGKALSSTPPDSKDILDNPFSALLQPNGSIYHLLEHIRPLIPKSGILIIDDLSILLSLGVPVKTLVFLVHYLQQFVSAEDCASNILVMMTGSMEDEDKSRLLKHVWHTSDLVLDAKGLDSGYCKDVHGQIVIHSRCKEGTVSRPEQTRTFQFKLLDKTVSLFAVGLSSAVL